MATTEDLTYAVRALATALDNVGCRIYRDVNPDSSYIAVEDERVALVLSDFTAYADEQLGVLDDPTIKRVVGEALRGAAR
jgi:hypothetical protein